MTKTKDIPLARAIDNLCTLIPGLRITFGRAERFYPGQYITMHCPFQGEKFMSRSVISDMELAQRHGNEDEAVKQRLGHMAYELITAVVRR